MVRWFILRTLLYKEFLRYRYNWGLLVVVAALLALSALVSLNARFGKIPGLSSSEIESCRIRYRTGTRGEEWINYLKDHRPAVNLPVYFEGYSSDMGTPYPAATEMAIDLSAPTTPSDDQWTATYWYAGEPPAGSIPIRDWFVRESNDFLGARPRLRELTNRDAGRSDAGEKVPFIIAALAIFALYLLSFNLFITSTAEEREKRVLLGLLLTPVKPVEVIAAKAIFYAAASLAVALAVVGMYQPRLLLNPLLWAATILGSLSYVAIGTVVVSVVRRQTTINTVSMLYLIGTSLIMILSQILPAFTILKIFLVENYLHSAMKLIVADEGRNQTKLGFTILLGIGALCWSVAAVWVFAKKGTAISRGR